MSGRVDVGRLVVLIYLIGMIVQIVFCEVCCCINDLFSVVIVNFGINIDYDVINILIVVNGVVVVVEVIVEVVYLCVVVICQVMMSVGQMSINGVLFQVLDIGVCRRNVQCYVSVVGQFYLFQYDSVVFLFSLIGVSIQVSFVCCREGSVGVYVIDINQFVIFVICNRIGISSVVDVYFIIISGCYNVVSGVICISFVIIVDIVVIVDSQMIIRVYCDNVVIVVSLSGISGMVVY